MARLPTFRRLLTDSLRFYRRHWRSLVAVTAVVAVPTNLMLAPTAAGASAAGSSAASFAAVYMACAIIWSIKQLEAGRRAGIREAYYTGTAPSLRFLLYGVILALALLPFAVGFMLFNLGVQSAENTAVEPILFGVVWLVLAIPTLWMLPRYIFGAFDIHDTTDGPITLLQDSRQLVRGRYWRVTWRLFLILALNIVVVAVPVAATTLLPEPARLAAVVWINVLSSLTLLPILYIYIYKLRQALA